MGRRSLDLELDWDDCNASKNLRHGGSGHSHHPRYKNSLEFIWHAAHNATVGTDWPTDGRYGVEIELVEPDRRRRDIANYVGVILDGIEGKVYEDDWQVDELTVIRAGPEPDRPRILVRVYLLEE